MAMAAYIIGTQKIASLASPKKRVVEQGFLEFFQDDGLTGSYSRLAGLLLDYASRILVLAQSDKLRMSQPIGRVAHP
jgi:hypothetical protein